MPLLPDPRRAAMAPVTQFPQQPLLDPLTAQMMQRRMGGTSQGLLDRSNAPAGLLGPAQVRPDILSGAGLLTPVIWDRLQRGINPMNTTEGAIPNYGGGGRGVPGQGEMLLEGGRGEAPKRPAEYDPAFKLHWAEHFDGDMHRAVTKSGVRVTVEKAEEDGRDVATVTFVGPHGEGGMHRDRPPGSTKQGIGRLEEVYGAVKDYLQTYGADTLKFTGATRTHDKVYDRVAPLMARALGGVLESPATGEYEIHIPNYGTPRR